MYRVRVLEETKKRSGTGAKGSWAFYYQAALVKLGNEVRQVWLEVRKDQQREPIYFAPGEYDYTHTHGINQFGEWELRREYTLEPVKAAQPAKAA